jgi:hypothetical protein
MPHSQRSSRNQNKGLLTSAHHQPAAVSRAPSGPTVTSQDEAAVSSASATPLRVIA